MALKSQTSFHSHHTVAASSGPRENVRLIKHWYLPKMVPASMGPKPGTSALKQLPFDSISLDKYIKLKNLRLEVNDIFKTHNTNQTDIVHIIKNLLDSQDL